MRRLILALLILPLSIAAGQIRPASPLRFATDQTPLNTMTIKVHGPVGKEITIFYGDGFDSTIVLDNSDQTINYDYSGTGDYDIIIAGDVNYLSEFDCHESTLSGDIGTCAKLERCTDLRVNSTSVTGDIGDLSGLTNLTYLYLNSTSVTGDIGDLSGLTNLTYLSLYSTSVTGDIGDLSGLTNLTYLYLNSTSVTGDIGDLNGLTNLTYLSLNSTSVDGDIGDLSGLTNLVYLYLNSTSVDGDIGDLSGLTNLVYLRLHSTSVDGDIGDLSGLTNLVYLYLNSTSVTDTLSELSGIVDVDYLYVYSTSCDGWSNVTLGNNWASDDKCNIQAQDCSWDQASVDQILIDLAAMVTGSDDGSLDIGGNNAARSAASDAAKTTLTNNGWAITVNE